MAVLLALLSSVLWGTSDFVGGSVSRRHPAAAVVGFAQAAGLVAALAACLLLGSFVADDVRDVALPAVGAGLTGLVGLVAFYAALAAGTMGVVAPIAALGVVVPVAVGVVDGDRPAWFQVVGLVAAIAGVVLASGPELRGSAGARPLLLACVSAVCFGLALTLLAVGSDTSTLLTLMLMRVAALAVLVVLAVALRSVGGIGRRDLPVLVAIGLGDVGANLTFGLASTQGLLSLVAVLGSLYPVVTVALARFFLHERLARVQYAGVAAALVGVALIAAGGA